MSRLFRIFAENSMKAFVTLLVASFSGIANCHAIIPDTVYIRKPESMELIYRNLEVITNDGYKIETWFFPAQNPPSESELRNPNENRRTHEAPGEAKRPTIIICNGDAGNMSYFQLYLAKNWTSRGFNVVTFDWRGFGKSSPFAMDRNYLCYTEMLEDYRAVIRKTSEQEEVLDGATAIVGWSTGAYLSMITAHTDNLVNAFIGRSLPTDFDDFIPLVMQYKNKTRNELLVPDDFPTELMPVHIAPEFEKTSVPDRRRERFPHSRLDEQENNRIAARNDTQRVDDCRKCRSRRKGRPDADCIR